MNRRKILIIVGIVILLVVFGYAIYLFFADREPAAGPRPGGLLPLPPPAGVTLPTDETLLVPAAQGAVEVRNFYPEALAVNETGDALIKDTGNYSLSYVAPEKRFQITVAAPVADNSRRGESDFLKTLDISQSEACRLNVSIFVPASVDVTRAGSYTLSFCPGGNPLR